MAGEIFMVSNLVDHFTNKRVRGSQSIKWPKTHYGAVVLIGEILRDGSQELDIDKAMADLGWQRTPAKPLPLPPVIEK